MSDLITAPSALNRQILDARHHQASGQYLTCMVGGDQFGLAVLAIREIFEFCGVTEVPMMPAYVRGILNLRGSVLPVLDLNARFGREQSSITRRSCIVIVEVASDDPDQPGDQVLGLVVDAVLAVLDIDSADIEPPPAFGTAVRTAFIDGMARMKGPQAGRFVTLLKLAPLVAIDDEPARVPAASALAA